uniref:Uncharacterized protein n=1 Tax=Arundo donax TaxID=35708 RepID=A0A0A9CQQ7_ARUDO
MRAVMSLKLLHMLACRFCAFNK